MRRLVLLLLTLVATLGATAAAHAVTFGGPSRSAYFAGAVGGKQSRPAELALTADGTLEVVHMHWSSWGGRFAKGTGTAEYHGCTPNCAAGKEHTRKVDAELGDRVKCKGTYYYNRVTLFTHGGPEFDRSYLHHANWAPCKVG